MEAVCAWGAVATPQLGGPSSRKGERSKQKQGAHEAVASYLMRPSLAQNAWRGSRQMEGERADE
jgi:hypothetical protein